MTMPGTGSMIAGQVSGSSTNQPIKDAFDTKATNLRVMMNTLLREHAAFGANTLIALYTGADTSKLEQLMKTNGTELMAVIQNIYGSSTANTFSNLWTKHMEEYKNYTIARKNTDNNGMTTARQHLQAIATDIGNLIAGRSKNLASSDVSSLMMEHINGTLAIVDAVAKGNATSSASLMKTAYDQAGTFADVLTKGMILDKKNW